jgi:hypothetical protein
MSKVPAKNNIATNKPVQGAKVTGNTTTGKGPDPKHLPR